jgi:hypothetical protein
MPRLHLRATLSILLPALLCGCTSYMPVQVTLINQQTNQPQPGVRIHARYDVDHQSSIDFTDEDWRTTDANGKAIIPITIDRWVTTLDSDGCYHKHRAVPELVVDKHQYLIVDGSVINPHYPLNVGDLRRAAGLTNNSNPFPVRLQIVPAASPATQPATE